MIHSYYSCIYSYLVSNLNYWYKPYVSPVQNGKMLQNLQKILPVLRYDLQIWLKMQDIYASAGIFLSTEV